MQTRSAVPGNIAVTKVETAVEMAVARKEAISVVKMIKARSFAVVMMNNAVVMGAANLNTNAVKVMHNAVIHIVNSVVEISVVRNLSIAVMTETENLNAVRPNAVEISDVTKT